MCTEAKGEYAHYDNNGFKLVLSVLNSVNEDQFSNTPYSYCHILIIQCHNCIIHSEVYSPTLIYTIAGVNKSELVKHRVYHQGDDVCVECYDNCIVIVHKNISLLNSTEGLLNITVIHQLNTRANENNTAHTCIYNDSDYQIAVIPWIDARKNTTQPLSPGGRHENI